MMYITFIHHIMPRKDHETCPEDINISLKKHKRTRFIKTTKRKWQEKPGCGLGPKKKKSYKVRMKNNLEKKIKKAKKMGIREGKRMKVGIGKFIYNCEIMEIMLTGKVKVSYGYNDIEMYSFRNFKNMLEHAEYIKDVINQRKNTRIRWAYIKTINY